MNTSITAKPKGKGGCTPRRHTLRQQKGEAAVWLVEALTALGLILLGLLVMWDSNRSGAGWAADGPETGYFPFWVAAFIVVSSIVVLLKAIKNRASQSEPFVESEQVKRILSVFIPTIIFTIAIKFIGIYFAGWIFIAIFMLWQGKYNWLKSLGIPAAVMAVLFAMFEIWFLVPLPKGPIERMLGF